MRVLQGSPLASPFAPHHFLQLASLLQPGTVQELARALTLGHTCGAHATLPETLNPTAPRARPAVDAPPRHNSDSNTMLEAASQLSGGITNEIEVHHSNAAS